MHQLSPQAVLRTPDYYPLRADFQRGTMKFVMMSAKAYRESVFLDTRTRYLPGGAFEARLDDLRLAVAAAPPPARRMHFIFNTSFCCSTLFARHFEAQPECLVLKEPVVLAQLAMAPERGSEPWKKALEIVLVLLARTYSPQHLVVIKPNEWCNSLAVELLRQEGVTATLLATPARDFLLTVLKDEQRRSWLRQRIPSALQQGQNYPGLAPITLRPEEASDAVAGCYVWLLNQCLFRRLATESETGQKVVRLNGNLLADAPESVLPAHFALCGFDGRVRPSVAETYSKGPNLAFTGADRSRDLAEQAANCGQEAEEALRWAESCGLGGLLDY